MKMFLFLSAASHFLGRTKMTEFATRLERKLAVATDYSQTNTMVFDASKNIPNPNGIISIQNYYNMYGVSADILGHAKLLKNDGNYQLGNLLYDLLEDKFSQFKTQSRVVTGDTDVATTYLLHRFKIALGWASDQLNFEFWQKPIPQITAQEAADLIRHIKITKSVPEAFSLVEKYYSDYMLSPPTKGILFYCKSNKFNNINGVGNSAEQAILDHSEQLIAREHKINFNNLS